jgi:hypothetical protein
MNAVNQRKTSHVASLRQVPVRMCEGGSSTPPEQQTEGPSKPNYYKVLGVSFGVRPRLRRDTHCAFCSTTRACSQTTNAPVRLHTPWVVLHATGGLQPAAFSVPAPRSGSSSCTHTPLRPVFLGALTRLTSLRHRLQRFHPDKHPGDQEATARFQQISEAFRGARAALTAL